MNIKKDLLKKIDAAIEDEKTTPETKELLKEARLKLEKAKTKSQVWEAIIYITRLIVALSKVF